MDYLKQFVIPFRGLKNDTHHFDFVIDRKFFDAIEYAELKNGLVHVSLDLEKQERMMIFDYDFTGYMEVECDRCLDAFKQTLEGRQRLIVNFGEAYEEQSDDIIIIPEGEYAFDVSTYIYEYINLLLPMQRIHPDDEKGNSTCNPKMLQRLSSLDTEDEVDPRWDVLKKLKQK